MEDDEFFDCLTNIVMAGTPDALTWTSESDIPLEVVRLPDSEVFHWIPETYILLMDEILQSRFLNPWVKIKQSATDENDEAFDHLAEAFENVSPMGRVFRRVEDKDKPYEISLYLLARFCGTWVGLATKLIET